MVGLSHDHIPPLDWSWGRTACDSCLSAEGRPPGYTSSPHQQNRCECWCSWKTTKAMKCAEDNSSKNDIRPDNRWQCAPNMLLRTLLVRFGLHFPPKLIIGWKICGRQKVKVSKPQIMYIDCCKKFVGLHASFQVVFWVIIRRIP